MSRIKLFSCSLGVDEWEAVARVFKSGWLGMGKECEAFEREFAAHVGVDRLLMLNCATAGLYMSLKAQCMPRGAEVIIPSIHFVATPSAVIENGGVPVFADVDPRTLNITADTIDRVRTERTWGVMLNHYGGHPCDMQPILDLCGLYGLTLIEDSANAIASTWHGRAVGTLGDAGIWSLDSMKVITAGDAGFLWLYDDQFHQWAWHLRNCGLSDTSGATNAEAGAARWWEFKVIAPSGRFDSNDIMAAIGREQLRKLPGFIERRKHIWSVYQQELADVGDLALPPEPLPGCTTSYYLYWIQTAKRDALARFLLDRDIYTTLKYYPLHRAFPGFEGVVLPACDHIAETTLCIPVHHELTDAEVDKIVTTIRGFYAK